MKRHRDEEVKKIRELRKNTGYSFAHLQRITGISSSTIRNWCTEENVINRWDTLLNTNQRKRQELKSSEILVLDSLKMIDPIQAKIYASLMYACEGAKYPNSNRAEFVNSNPSLIKLFVMLLRKSFVLDELKFRIHMQIHTTHDFAEIKKFWSNLLNIPQSQFIKPTITKARGGKYRREYFGTCSVRYVDYRIQLKLIGIYEAFIKKFGEVA